MKARFGHGARLGISAFAVIVCGTGCGGGDVALTDADKAICDAAAQNLPIEVDSLSDSGDNDDVRKAASKIIFGSSAESDAAAMREIVDICSSGGYSPRSGN